MVCYRNYVEKQTDQESYVPDDARLLTNYFYLHQFKNGKRRTLYWRNPESTYSQKHLNFIQPEQDEPDKQAQKLLNREFHLFYLEKMGNNWYLRTHYVNGDAPNSYYVNVQNNFFSTNADIHFLTESEFMAEKDNINPLILKNKGEKNYNIEINGEKFKFEISKESILKKQEQETTPTQETTPAEMFKSF